MTDLFIVTLFVFTIPTVIVSRFLKNRSWTQFWILSASNGVGMFMLMNVLNQT